MPNIINHNIKHNTVKDYINRRKPSNVKIVKNSQQFLGKDSFLKLLVQELKHQDPLKPMSDKEFISQMAQFSSLEQMNNVSKSMESLKRFQANFLVGKTVTGKDYVSGQYIKGNVSKVIHDGSGNAFLRVNGRSIKFEDISEVENSASIRQKIHPSRNSYSNYRNNYNRNVSRETFNNQTVRERAKVQPKNQTMVKPKTTTTQQMKVSK